MPMTFKYWKKSEMFLHLLVWIVFFSFPFLISGGEREPMVFNFIFGVYLVPVLFYAVVFYFNYFLLIDHYWFSKRFLIFSVFNILFLVVGIWFIDLVRDLLIIERPRHYQLSSMSNKAIWNYSRILISYILTVGIAVSIKMTKNWFAFEDQKKQLENERLKSELNGLKYQLQPHFFFNTLNNIYALVDASPEQSKDALHQLSKMMRYLLYETEGETIQLSKELNFTTSYIELMKMRIPKHVQVNYHFPTHYQNIEVLHLLFISLVENAFKHGVSSQESFIDIHCDLSETLLTFKVSNSNYPKQELDRSGSGIGVENLRKRMELHPSKNYKLTTMVENGIHHAVIEVQL
jgi:sensor histidine kinase YesM